MSFCSWQGKEHFRDHYDVGVYVCSQCGNKLFSSKSKYAHDSPWPAFSETVHSKSLRKREERHNIFKVSCGQCGQGLGHEFVKDGPEGKSRF